MENKIVEIVYIVTGDYCNYAKDFFGTLKFFMPGVKKIVTVLSDKMEEYGDFTTDDVIKTNVIKMFDLIYPCINLHKSYFIEQLPNSGADYILYFDADTKFKEVNDYKWDDIFSAMDCGNVIISRHPVYAMKDGEFLFGVEKKYFIENFFSTNMTERDERRASYIPAKEYTYIISSFFGAKREVMSKLNKYIISMTRKDLTRETIYHIPPYMDENYFNAINYDFENKINSNVKFCVNQYSELLDTANDEYDTVFMYQKNFKNFKTNRR